MFASSSVPLPQQWICPITKDFLGEYPIELLAHDGTYLDKMISIEGFFQSLQPFISQIGSHDCYTIDNTKVYQVRLNTHFELMKQQSLPEVTRSYEEAIHRWPLGKSSEMIHFRKFIIAKLHGCTCSIKDLISSWEKEKQQSHSIGIFNLLLFSILTICTAIYAFANGIIQRMFIGTSPPGIREVKLMSPRGTSILSPS